MVLIVCDTTICFLRFLCLLGGREEAVREVLAYAWHRRCTTKFYLVTWYGNERVWLDLNEIDIYPLSFAASSKHLSVTSPFLC